MDGAARDGPTACENESLFFEYQATTIDLLVLLHTDGLRIFSDGQGQLVFGHVDNEESMGIVVSTLSTHGLRYAKLCCQ